MSDSQPTSTLIKADQLDYATRPVLEPRYRYLPVSLNSQPANAIPIQPTTTQLLEFKLPSARVVNFARSYINYDHDAPPQAAGKRIAIFEDVSTFASSAILASSNNTELVRLDNLQQRSTPLLTSS